MGSSNAGLGLFHLALLNQPSANGSLHGTVPLVVVMGESSLPLACKRAALKRLKERKAMEARIAEHHK